MNNAELIARAKESALAGRILDRENIIALLGIDSHSEDCRALGRAAREAASVICKDRAYIWAAIGLDCKPCPMSCTYCALGERWGIVREESELSSVDIIDCAKNFVNEGARWIVLRTTQCYDLDRLAELTREIKKAVPGHIPACRKRRGV